jgi:hypothetical protein
MRRARLAVVMLGLGLATAVPPAVAIAEGRVRQGEQLRRAALLVRAEFALERLGYGIDLPDGLPDARTGAALEHFSRGAGLPGSEPMDQALVAMLEAAAAARAEERLALARARREAEERLVRADLAAKAEAERRLAGT